MKTSKLWLRNTSRYPDHEVWPLVKTAYESVERSCSADKQMPRIVVQFTNCSGPYRGRAHWPELDSEGRYWKRILVRIGTPDKFPRQVRYPKFKGDNRLMVFSIPIFIEERPEGINKSSSFVVRPLFYAKPVQRAEKLGRALSKLTAELQQLLFELGREPRHDQLAEWTFHPTIEEMTVDLRLELESGSKRTRFFLAGYARQKTGSLAMIHFGPDIEAVLRQMPAAGPLFPYLQTVRSGDRATEFKQRCDGLGIKGVSLHSYRYAWAERAKMCGYPERFAQEALGHNSKAVHRAYARKAQVRLPSLESYEKQSMAGRIIPLLPPLPKPETNGHSFSAAG